MPYFPPSSDPVLPILSVTAAANTNQAITSNLPTIDLYSTSENDRVLLTQQSTDTENGIWVVHAASAWERPADFATGLALPVGTLVFVVQGTQYSDSYFTLIGGIGDVATFTVGTSSITPAGLVDPFSWDRNDAGHTLATGGVIIPNGLQVKAGVTTGAAVPGEVVCDTLTIANADTTIARVSSGKISVEGVDIVTTSSSDALTNKTLTSGTNTFPTFNQDTTGTAARAAALTIPFQTALLHFDGLTSTDRGKTVRDAADTILELGGSYTPTGNWTNLKLITPTLGTPASGTLTNCTALPVAGITSSTSTALGVGSLELGAASDTTLSRPAAGQLAVEGADAIPAMFLLTADGSAIGGTIADFFGSGSAYPTVLNARYIIHCEIFYTKTTAGTVTFTMTNSQTYTNIAMKYLGSPAGGMISFNNCAEIGIDNTTTAAAALPATSSLNNASEHQASIWALAEVGTAGTIKLQVTCSAGTVTPRRGSYMQITRLPAGNVGGWA